MRQPSILVALASLTLLLGAACAGAAGNATPPPDIQEGKSISRREPVEWMRMWLPGLEDKSKAHVLLVGDSITDYYQAGVTKALAPKARVGYFVTSLGVADPAFEQTLKAVLSMGKFDVIHLNNGLHDGGRSEKDYEAGLRRALEQIRQSQPGARVVLVLSTPLQEKSAKAFLNPLMDKRNAIVRKLAKEFSLAVDDLNTPMRNHPEYHEDPYHFKGNAVKIQAEIVSGIVEAELAKGPVPAGDATSGKK